MGVVGRFCLAYVSKDLTLRYYKYKTGRSNFNPVIKVSGGVEGRGTMFRVALMLSLFIILLNRKSLMGMALMVIVFSCFAQPALTTGYARYVPQMVAIPVIAVCDFIALNKNKSYRIFCYILLFFLGVYSMVLNLYSLSFFALKWITSEQNLAIVKSMQKQDEPCLIYASNMCSAKTLKDAVPGKIKFVDKNYGKTHPEAKGFSSYFSFYVYYPSAGRIENFPALNHVASGGKKNVIKSRNKHNIKFFLNDFLFPRLLNSPAYIYSVYKIRLQQLINAWSNK